MDGGDDAHMWITQDHPSIANAVKSSSSTTTPTDEKNSKKQQEKHMPVSLVVFPPSIKNSLEKLARMLVLFPLRMVEEKGRARPPCDRQLLHMVVRLKHLLVGWVGLNGLVG